VVESRGGLGVILGIVGMWCGWRGYYLRGRTPSLHPEDVNGIRKTKFGMVGREGGREGGTWGVPLSISSVFILFLENFHYPSPQAPTPNNLIR